MKFVMSSSLNAKNTYFVALGSVESFVTIF